MAVGQKNAGQRPAVQRPGGTKSGLALGEWGGGDDARTFFDRDDLIGWDIGGVIGLAAGPPDFYRVGFSVIAKAEGEDQFAGREVAAAAG